MIILYTFLSSPALILNPASSYYNDRYFYIATKTWCSTELLEIGGIFSSGIQGNWGRRNLNWMWQLNRNNSCIFIYCHLHKICFRTSHPLNLQKAMKPLWRSKIHSYLPILYFILLWTLENHQKMKSTLKMN